MEARQPAMTAEIGGSQIMILTVATQAAAGRTAIMAHSATGHQTMAAHILETRTREAQALRRITSGAEARCAE